ncbi:hypothetical protein GCM10020216_044740 [Nonomuraea helvata]
MGAEDLVQITLARAWQAWRRIKGDPDPYVYRILTNTHASWWRKRWRGEVPTESLPDTTARGDFARELGEKDALWAAIRGLSDRQRAVIVLHYFEDLTLPQCADVLGCSLGTVKTQLGRARQPRGAGHPVRGRHGPAHLRPEVAALRMVGRAPVHPRVGLSAHRAHRADVAGRLHPAYGQACAVVDKRKGTCNGRYAAEELVRYDVALELAADLGVRPGEWAAGVYDRS